ncbi:MAG TPA: DUF3795 domain-containing protein [Anaerolineae bacterium]|nr:DUF3795 domain-containing protein [Anaerolineae bacterium]HQM14007.1 DUF3795 domain-containing protein [Anaerolineae bacterium]
MERIVAYCGLVCSECEAYLLTQANDTAGLERLAAKWRREYNAPDMTAANVMCDGCLAGERLNSYGSMCPIRACGSERGVANCAHCADYACANLQQFFNIAPSARETLEEIRRPL